MRKLMKTIANPLLKTAGVSGGVDGIVRRERYEACVRELYGCLSTTLFPDLPDNPDRERLVCRLLGTTTSEAMYILNHLHLGLSAEGDICEFGVAQGATSALIANEIKSTDKRFWLFDSFAGLPKPTEEDVLIDDIFKLGSMDAYEGLMSHPVEEVRARLEDVGFDWDRVRVVPGMIEETVAFDNLPDKVCFAYVDFDFYSGIKVTLEFLENRLTPGGQIVVDDYGFFSAGAQQAVDEFIASREGRFEIIKPHEFAGHFCMVRHAG